jgi:acetyl esterase/lipase
MSPKFNLTATVEEQRRAFENLAKFSILPSRTAVQPVHVGDVPAEWISVGTTSEERAVLYLHGGAYTIGSPRTHRDIAARISKAAGARILLIDYRLAPEHPHPAAVQDVVAAYRWMLEYGLSPHNIAIAGDSAGGGLAIAALVSLRDTGEPLPAAAVCLSPWTDLQGTGESMTTHIEADPFLTPEWLQLMAKHFVENNDPRMPLISPIHADLGDLPPILIQVGSDEILFSDSIRLVERAREAGVETTLDVWEGMWHVWQFFAGQMPEGRRAIDEVGSFIRSHLNPQGITRA